MTDKLLTEDPLRLKGTTIDNRYRVTGLVDEGGFGYLYKAHHVMWDKPVALKIFKRLRDKEKQEALKEAFIKEGAVLSELSRKTTSIVQSRDIGELPQDDGTKLLYTVLEWLEGGPLSAVVAAERGDGGAAPWSLARIIRIVEPVAHALEVAHDSGVAHRDIKPSNIFLVQENEGAKINVKLLDFGVAKVVGDLGQGFDQTGQSRGAYTPAYAAPEQFTKRHGTTGPWTDVYSLAMVCVELLLGRYPFDSDNFGQLVFSVCDTDKRPTPREAGMEIDDDLNEVFAKALAVTTADRYQTVGEFWHALLHSQAGRAALEQIGEEDDEGGDGRVRTLVSPAFSLAAGRSSLKSEPPYTTTPQVVMASDAKPASRWPMITAFLAAVVIGGGGMIYWKTRGQGVSTTAEVASAPEKVASAQIDEQRLASFAPLPTVVNSLKNPLSKPKIDLGRMLFYDQRLSQNGDLSCNSCHLLDNYGVDGERFSTGHAGQKSARNSPSVYHAAGAFALTWDGREENLEEQATSPLLNPNAMAMTEQSVVRRLKKIPGYVKAFAAAFPESPGITLEKVGMAIGAFERGLFTPGKWDAFLSGKKDALTDAEKIGFNEFVEVGCVTCHFGPYVGASMYQKLGLIRAWPDTKDRGRFELTKNNADFMVFRVPSLRNVAKTGPYLHDGSLESLDEVVALMATHQLGRELKPSQVSAIVTWMKTLTGTLPTDYISKPELPADD